MNRTNIDDTQAAHSDVAGARSGERARNGTGKHDDGGSEHPGSRVDVARLREVGRNLGAQLEQQAVRRPYAVVGAALGVGFVTGSIFGSRLGQVLLAVGLGYAAKNVIGSTPGLERLQSGIDKLTGALDAD